MNADLFYLLALQQACHEGIVHSHYPSGCAVWCLFTLVRPIQAVGWADGCTGPNPCPAKRWDSPGTPAPASASLDTDSLGEPYSSWT